MNDPLRARPPAAGPGTLLVVDDEPDLRTLYELTLLREGYEIETAGSVEEALLRLAERSYSAIITDMRLPDGTGLDLLRRLEDTGRSEKAIVITAYGSAENAVEALKAGAYDYLTKPVDLKQFRSVVASALGRPGAGGASVVLAHLPSEFSPAAAPATRGNRAVIAQPQASTALARMAGQSGAMQQVRAMVHKVARSMAPVLVNGESGTGKELVARAIHEVSARCAQPFVAVNCGAIPEQLLEAEFFGYRKGAFTGAAEDRAGFFQAAHGGTLFLDEIGDLPLAMQSKLLRAIQERAVRPVAAPAVPASQAMRRMAGQSNAMAQVRELVDKVARSMAPVLVCGESGTGKELVARAIHEVSVRGAQPFIAVNCGAIPEQLLEAEFFGYRKGAFTGAAEDREGFFQAANGGTLFLDEIGDLPLAMQSKLLRSVQERSVRPVGAVSEQPVNVRLLSATHKDLGAEVQAGRFRQDLYYRLNVIQIRVPPLRERLEDLAGISERVLDRIAADAGVSPAPRLTREALALLTRYAFPGNVRELENLLHRAVALSGGETIDVPDLGLPESLVGEAAAQEFDGAAEVRRDIGRQNIEALPLAPVEVPLPQDLAVYLDAVERDILVRALERYRFNRTAAGASLGLSLRQMRYRMARLGVNVGGDLGDRE